MLDFISPTAAGTILQAAAIGYLVYQSYLTMKKIKGLKFTYDEFQSSMESLNGELRSRYSHDGIAFILTLMGMTLQLMG